MKNAIDWLVALPMAAVKMDLLLESAAKGTVILTIGAIVVAMLYRASAALRHLVWSVSLGALLVIPIMSLVMPKWRALPLPSSTKLERTVQFAVESTRQTAIENSVASTAEGHQTLASRVEEYGIVGGSHSFPEFQNETTGMAEATTPSMQQEWVPTKTTAWAVFLSFLWAVLSVVLLLRIVVSRCILGRVLRQAAPIDRGELWDELVTTADQLSIRREIHLYVSSLREVPMTWGISRICILLPSDCTTWSYERLKSVLLHELAHVKRFDTVSHVAGQVACSVYWFNPLVWFATWRCHVEREQACDDLVLQHGIKSSDYAEHLLGIISVSKCRPSAPCAALAMARRSRLEGRLLAILNDKLNRKSVTSSVLSLVTTVGLVVAIIVAALQAAELEQPVADDQPLLRPGSVIHHPQQTERLAERWDWGLDQAKSRQFQSGFWMAYSIHRRMDKGAYIGSLSLPFDLASATPLSEVITGTKPDQEFPITSNGESPVLKEVAFLFRLRPKTFSRNGISQIEVSSLELSVNLEGLPLIWLGPASDEESVSLLLQFYEGLRSTPLRQEMVFAASLHQNSALVLRVLNRIYKAGDAEIRKEVALGLSRLRDGAGIPRLIEISRTAPKPEVRQESVQWLGKSAESCGDRADADTLKQAIVTLKGIVDTDPNTEVQKEAVQALGGLANKSGVEVLKNTLSTHPKVAVREEAIDSLRKVAESVSQDADTRRQVIVTLERVVHADPSGHIQKEAVQALGRLPNESGLEPLQRILNTHPNLEVREEAIESIRRLDVARKRQP